MNSIEATIMNYLDFCQYQKRLDSKTRKAYRIDLAQAFSRSSDHFPVNTLSEITPIMLENYISTLHKTYMPKTVKRKIASLKAFFHYLEYRDFININPFNKIQTRFREPVILPKTIPLHTIEVLLTTLPANKRHYLTHSVALLP